MKAVRKEARESSEWTGGDTKSPLLSAQPRRESDSLCEVVLPRVNRGGRRRRSASGWLDCPIFHRARTPPHIHLSFPVSISRHHGCIAVRIIQEQFRPNFTGCLDMAASDHNLQAPRSQGQKSLRRYPVCLSSVCHMYGSFLLKTRRHLRYSRLRVMNMRCINVPGRKIRSTDASVIALFCWRSPEFLSISISVFSCW